MLGVIETGEDLPLGHETFDHVGPLATTITDQRSPHPLLVSIVSAPPAPMPPRAISTTISQAPKSACQSRATSGLSAPSAQVLAPAHLAPVAPPARALQRVSVAVGETQNCRLRRWGCRVVTAGSLNKRAAPGRIGNLQRVGNDVADPLPALARPLKPRPRCSWTAPTAAAHSSQSGRDFALREQTGNRPIALHCSDGRPSTSAVASIDGSPKNADARRRPDGAPAPAIAAGPDVRMKSISAPRPPQSRPDRAPRTGGWRGQHNR